MGADGRSIGLLWTNTVAFQKLQRYAHGDIALDDYLDFVATRRGEQPACFASMPAMARSSISAPGVTAPRRRSERANGTAWSGLRQLVHRVERAIAFAPSQALTLNAPTRRENAALETAAYPVPVKKQRKYNLTRWAVTGRDDIAINAACERIYAALSEQE